MSIKQKSRIVSLFCGCGGFDLGAHLAGFEVDLAIDIDPILASAYRHNFPETDLHFLDLEKVTCPQIKRLAGNKRPAGVIGGPPCQGFSIIGKRNLQDDRNLLVDYFFKHVAWLEPKFFVMENVPRLLSPKAIRILERGLDRLPNFYTILRPMILDARDFGAPTVRKRAFIVGFDAREVDPFDINAILDLRAISRVSVRDAISDLPEPQRPSDIVEGFDWIEYPNLLDGGPASDYACALRSAPPAELAWTVARERLASNLVSGLQPTYHLEEVKRRFRSTRPGKAEPVSRYPRLEWEGQCSTLRAGTGRDRGSYQAVRPIHPEQPRVITVREAARFQGFPDWFVFHPTKWHSFRMIGNSVSPIVARALLGLIAKKCGLSVSQIERAA